MKSQGANDRDLVPLYIADRLSPAEREAFEEALENDPQLQKEMDEFLLIQGGYKDLEQDLPLPSARVLERVRENIQKDRMSKKKNPLLHGLLGYLGSLFSTPKMAWSVAAVQLVLLLLLVSGAFQETEYRTLSSDPSTAESGFQIHVVFKGEAMEQDLRSLLQRTGLQIKDGPDDRGLYVLEGMDHENAQETLEILQGSGIVRFAQLHD
ncbi:MAG: hypothetical protein PVG49_04225 [Desulfobacteraceae bacterium]|jgi:anti-sigma factor RsiW